MENVIPALEKARGNVSVAAKRLGYSRQTLYTFLKEHPEANTVVLDARASRADLAEDKLTTALRKAEPWAIQYALSTLGRDRGYIVKIPDVVSAGNLEALRRIVSRLGLTDISDERLMIIALEVKAEMDAEKA